MESILEFSKTYSSLITVIGSLIVFFSWIIEKTLKDSFSDLKSKIRKNSEDSRMFSFLSELRDGINSVTSEIVQPKLAERLNQVQKFDSANHDFEVAKSKYYKNVLSSHQLRELNELCARTYDLAKAAIPNKEVTNLVEDLTIEVSDNYQKLSSFRTNAEKSIQANGQATNRNSQDELVAAVNLYDNFLRNELLSKTPSYFEKAVKLSNEVNNAVKVKFQRVSAWVNIFKRFRLIFYILGTTLILYSKYIESIKS